MLFQRGGPLVLPSPNSTCPTSKTKYLKQQQLNPSYSYVHYVDDIFIVTHSYDEVNKLKQTLEKNSVLNSALIKKIPFLDVLTDSCKNNKFITSPYKKPTNDNSPVNAYKSIK